MTMRVRVTRFGVEEVPMTAEEEAEREAVAQEEREANLARAQAKARRLQALADLDAATTVDELKAAVKVLLPR